MGAEPGLARLPRRVKARFAPPEPQERRTENWKAIYEEIIRRLLRDPDALEFGKMEGFVRDLGEWARKEHGTRSVPSDKRLRKVIDEEIIKPVQAVLKSNKR